MDNFVKYRYGWEKFYCAILTLASSGSLPQRIIDAYTFSIINLKKEDIPEPLQEKFEELTEMLTRKSPIRDEGSVSATVNSLDELELKEAAELMVSLYDSICRFMPNHHSQ